MHYSPRFFEDFNYNACAIITKPNEFKKRLYSKLKEYRILKKYYYEKNKIHYYDPCVWEDKAFLDEKNINIVFSKKLKYSCEKEYRLSLITSSPSLNELEKNPIKIGSLDDICKVIYLD